MCVCKCTSVLFRHMCKGEGVENQCWESYYFFSAYILSSLPLQLSSQKTRLSIGSSILAHAKQCCLVAMVSIILPASFGLKDKALTIDRWVNRRERERLSKHTYMLLFLYCHPLFKVIAHSLVFEPHPLSSRGGRKSAQHQHLLWHLMFNSVGRIF